MPGSPPAEIAHLRSRHARAVQCGRADQAAVLRRELEIAQLERHVRAVVDAAPPLSKDQRDKLAALLRPTPREA